MDGYTHYTNGCTTATTIEKLQLSFSTFGLPQVLVSDNGPAFSSTEFQEYMKLNGINHVKTVPYHPASNGLAERAVKTFKSALKKLNTGSLQSRVNDFLFKYRITPQTTTGPQPSCCLGVSCVLSWTYSFQVLLTRYSAIRIYKSAPMITMLETDSYS